MLEYMLTGVKHTREITEGFIRRLEKDETPVSTINLYKIAKQNKQLVEEIEIKWLSGPHKDQCGYKITFIAR